VNLYLGHINPNVQPINGILELMNYIPLHSKSTFHIKPYSYRTCVHAVIIKLHTIEVTLHTCIDMPYMHTSTNIRRQNCIYAYRK